MAVTAPGLTALGPGSWCAATNITQYLGRDAGWRDRLPGGLRNTKALRRLVRQRSFQYE